MHIFYDLMRLLDSQNVVEITDTSYFEFLRITYDYIEADQNINKKASKENVMFVQTASRTNRPFSRTQMIAKQVRGKELMAMCIIRFEANECKPSMLELARKCKRVLTADLSPELDVVFVGLDQTSNAHLTEWRAKHHLHTLGDWARTLRTLLAPGSDNCPNCGLATFADPETVPLFCEACGANPGTVFKNAGGIFPPLST